MRRAFKILSSISALLFLSILTFGHASAVEIILDNAALGVQDTVGGRTFTGKWCTSIATAKFGANSFYSCGSGPDTYRWTPKIIVAGSYCRFQKTIAPIIWT